MTRDSSPASDGVRGIDAVALGRGVEPCHAPGGAPPPPPAFQRELYLLGVMFLFIFMGAGAQQAYLVSYLGRTTPWSGAQRGAVIACTYLAMLPFRLLNLRLFPNWSDRRFALVGSLAYLQFTLVMAATPRLQSFPLLILAALAWGAGAAMMWTGTSMRILRLSDMAGGRHGTGMGFLYASTHAGWLAGAVFLGILYQTLATPRLWLLYAAAAALTLLGNLTATLLPVTERCPRCRPTLRAVAQVMARPRARIAGLLQFASALAYGLILGTFARFVEQRYGREWIWLTVSLYPATQMLLSLAGGSLSDRIGQAPILVTAFLAGAMGLFLGVVVASPWSAAFTALTLGFLNSTVTVAAGAIVGRAADEARRPLVYGVVYGWRDLGIALATLASTVLGLSFEVRHVFLVFAAVYVVCACGAALLGKYSEQAL
ncbi:MAG: MFS transporter [Lentisphaeria bacterium]|nr:MFS transporter [Lentisphaeria bacterium]